MGFGVLAGEGALGAFVASYFVLFAVELLAPFRVGLDDLLYGRGAFTSAVGA